MKSALRSYYVNYLGIAILGTVLSGCASKPEQAQFSRQIAQQMAASAVPGDEKTEMSDYQINVGDELDIKFNEHDNLNAQVKVRPDGRISLHLIGDLLAAGITAHELEPQISQKYRELNSSLNGLQSESDKAYLISVNDELVVKFPYHDHMDQTVKVRPDGFISLSLVNEVAAEHKTPEALEAELNRKYLKYLKNPTITVVVKQFSSSWYEQNGELVLAGLDNLSPTVIVKSFESLEIFVAGNVEKPGILGYRPTLTALGAIIESGGQKQGSQMGEVVVLRKGVKNPIAMKLNLDDDDNGSQAARNVHLKPFDVVYVPKSAINEAGDFVQEIGRIIPPLKNSSFSFLVDVLRNTTSQNAITTQQ
ncbi:MAG: polysaccharide biosynthesis/export family protein [Methylococcaceae bacterium]|nr:polysaccharide biosynthesis/export family protein [Methylococcaceae bacterium]